MKQEVENKLRKVHAAVKSLVQWFMPVKNKLKTGMMTRVTVCTTFYISITHYTTVRLIIDPEKWQAQWRYIATHNNLSK